mgnify:CR=1 FL=1
MIPLLAQASAEASISMWPFAILSICVVFIVVAITMLRVHAFLALILAAILAGILTGDLPNLNDLNKGLFDSRVALDMTDLEGNNLIKSVKWSLKGFGNTAGGIGLVIALAAIIGTCLMGSGAADRSDDAYRRAPHGDGRLRPADPRAVGGDLGSDSVPSLPGGAAARPFITHHNALDVPLYLRIANELYLKRLIVGGFEGVYEFAKDFRNEGMDKTHNPEFTVMEIYVAYKDYHWMMRFVENMLEEVAMAVNGTTDATIGENTVSFKAPYARVPILEAIKEHTGLDLSGKTEDEVREAAKSIGLEVDETMGKGKLIDEIFGEKCEKHYIQPTYITDYPVEMSPLCKKHRDNPELTERFELMVNGKEVANAYSELNDPIDQLERFEDQLKLSEKGDDEAMFIDQDFVRALEYGMPPTSGLGIGIDRLTMMLTNQDSIQEVLLFPQMRPEKFDTVASPQDFEAVGVPAEWAVHIAQAGYHTVEALLGNKPAALHQKLNGYRKKNKLDVAALQLDTVESWFK